MRWIKLAVFSLLPAAVVFALLEGAAQLYWLHREAKAMNAVAANGEKQLQNDAIHFMKEPDGVLGYRLKANLNTGPGGTVTNSRGLAQAEETAYGRAPQSLRVMCVGESTTMGSSKASYPTQLRVLLSSLASGYSGGVEVINAGVAGWVSDQWTLYSERELRKYAPDIVILYAGWNDFGAYDPKDKPHTTSVFEGFYGKPRPAVTGLKSVVIARAFLDRLVANKQAVNEESASSSPDVIYRFYLRSLSRTIAAFREDNPQVKVVLSSLVARWPMETRAAFLADRNLPWTIKKRGVGPIEAAALLKPFNTLIEQYTRDKGILFVDMARVFEDLDRPKLLWDYAHMSEDGYRIVAHVFYRRLLQAGELHGRENPELDALLEKYAVRPKTGS